MQKRVHWRLFLLRWHRRIGLVAALFVLLLVITGVLLNHGHDLGLDRRPLENAWLRQHYGLVPESTGLVHTLASGELSARDGQLHLNGKALGDCARLVGVIEQAQQVLAVCSNRLLLLTPGGELVDQADSLRGVPEGLSAVSSQGGGIVLQRGESRFGVDLSDLSVTPLAGAGQAGSGTTPAIGPGLTAGSGAAGGSGLAAGQGGGAGSDAGLSPPTPASDDVTWERVILDLHSGRLFGRGGVWLVDIMAVLFAVLALSGFAMALRRRHRGA